MKRSFLWLLTLAWLCGQPWTAALWGQEVVKTKVGDWAQFRGPGGLGISQAQGLPVTWSADKNLRWRLDLPGAGSSSPIVVGARVLVTCYSGFGVRGQAKGEMNQLKRHVLCLSLTTGKILWQTDVPAALPESATVRDHGYAASTPACDGERLYVFFGKSGVFAFDLDGRQLWQADVGAGAHGWGSAASPVLHGNLVIINACVESESLVALDKKTGKEMWRLKGIRESWNTPVLVDLPGGKNELVVVSFKKVLGIDPNSGKQLWSCAFDVNTYVCPSVVAHDGIVYANVRSKVLAIRAGGRGDVTGSHLLWQANKGANVPSPVLHGGHLYWTHERDGIAYCAEAKTGKIVYEERLPRAGQFYASPVLADGKLYYVARGYDAGVFVVAAQPRFELLAHNKLGDRSTFDASPAVSGNRLLLRSDRFLYCIGQ